MLKSTKNNIWHWLSTKPGLLLALFLNGMQSWGFYYFLGIDASALAYLMGAFTVFIFLVDNRDDRFLKGFFLIGYGVMIQFSYDLVFKHGLEGSHWETLRGLVHRAGSMDALIRWLQLHPHLN